MKKDTDIKVFYTSSEEETESAAQAFARFVKKGDIICFFGDVGSGKTVYTRGLCKGLGFDGYVNSPSYIIMNMYDRNDLRIHHFDLYRINDPEELREIGFYDFIHADDSVAVIEWADIIKDRLPDKRIEIRIEVIDEERRKIEIARFE